MISFSNQQDNEMEHLNKRIQTVAVPGGRCSGLLFNCGPCAKAW